jgi:exodeoxyribonuclease V beta subunit
VQLALHDLQIPGVEQAMASVFESDAARELQWILAAILNPGHEAGVKCALTTDALGWNGNQLEEFIADEAAWQSRLQEFAEYRAGWERDGFFSMFLQLLRREKIVENLMRFPDAERRITNVLHLAELLAAASKTEHLGPARLVQWLEKRRASDDAAADEFQLRLESDEDAVQIITIHRAKGLEYPVVFCPFVSKDAELGKIKSRRQTVMDVVLFHDPATSELTWDLNPMPSAAHEQQATKEQLAERVRLLYVALTRACHRCYLVSAPYARKKSTALAWLLNGQGDHLANPVAFLDEQDADPVGWKNRWLAIAAKTPSAIAVGDLPLEPGQPWQPEMSPAAKLISKTCDREIKPSWFLSSFTQLSQQIITQHEIAGAPDLPDYDATAAPPRGDLAEEPAAAGIFALPAGARTGDCLHKILEQFDFANADKASTAILVKQQLTAFGLATTQHIEAVTDMLERLRHTPLDAENLEFTLANVSRTRRLSELEFYFPTAQLNADKLFKLIRDGKISPTTRRDTPTRIEGFLKGFIDLVFEFGDRFYIVDWKSNSLGHRVEDFNPAAMRREIAERGYDLQYYIYTAALDKYLRSRLAGYDYQKHFGGIRYIFLRGVTPEQPELGVFHDRPPVETIAELSLLLGKFAEVKP